MRTKEEADGRKRYTDEAEEEGTKTKEEEEEVIE